MAHKGDKQVTANILRWDLLPALTSCLSHAWCMSPFPQFLSAAYHFKDTLFSFGPQNLYPFWSCINLPACCWKGMEPLISSCILELLETPQWQSQLGDSQHHLAFLFHFVLFWLFFNLIGFCLFQFFLCGEFIYSFFFFFWEQEKQRENENVLYSRGLEHKHEVRQGGLGEQKNGSSHSVWKKLN